MKNTSFFKHYSNARNEEKIIILRHKLGMEGYGAYLMLLEILGENSNLKLSLNSLEAIAWELHLDFGIVQSVVLNFSLFKIDKHLFWSEKILKNE